MLKEEGPSVEESTTASQAGSQDTIMVGSVGSYLDVGSVSEVTLEPRGADEKISFMGAPNVRERESVDIEIDSGAEVICLPPNIVADTYPLHETRLSMCGGHHVAAGGGKLHELGARILGLEAAYVRGGVVNLLVINMGKSLLSTQDLSRCGWETVFLAGCGDAYLVSYTESEEFLEVMSMDHRAGVWPVEEGGGSSSCGRGRRACEKARGKDSSNRSRPRRAHGQRTRSVQNLVSRMLHQTWPNASTSWRWKRHHFPSNCH